MAAHYQHHPSFSSSFPSTRPSFQPATAAALADAEAALTATLRATTLALAGLDVAEDPGRAGELARLVGEAAGALGRVCGGRGG